MSPSARIRSCGFFSGTHRPTHAMRGTGSHVARLSPRSVTPFRNTMAGIPCSERSARQIAREAPNTLLQRRRQHRRTRPRTELREIIELESCHVNQIDTVRRERPKLAKMTKKRLLNPCACTIRTARPRSRALMRTNPKRNESGPRLQGSSIERSPRLFGSSPPPLLSATQYVGQLRLDSARAVSVASLPSPPSPKLPMTCMTVGNMAELACIGVRMFVVRFRWTVGEWLGFVPRPQ